MPSPWAPNSAEPLATRVPALTSRLRITVGYWPTTSISSLADPGSPGGLRQLTMSPMSVACVRSRLSAEIGAKIEAERGPLRGAGGAGQIDLAGDVGRLELLQPADLHRDALDHGSAGEAHLRRVDVERELSVLDAVPEHARVERRVGDLGGGVKLDILGPLDARHHAEGHIGLDVALHVGRVEADLADEAERRPVEQIQRLAQRCVDREVDLDRLVPLIELGDVNPGVRDGNADHLAAGHLGIEDLVGEMRRAADAAHRRHRL